MHQGQSRPIDAPPAHPGAADVLRVNKHSHAGAQDHDGSLSASKAKSPRCSGYQPACANEWGRGGYDEPGIKCFDCPNRRFLPQGDQSRLVLRRRRAEKQILRADPPLNAILPAHANSVPLLLPTNRLCRNFRVRLAAAPGPWQGREDRSRHRCLTLIEASERSSSSLFFFSP